MDPTVTKNPIGKEFHVTSVKNSLLHPDDDVSVTVIPSKNSDHMPTIIIDSSPNDHDLTVTPAFPNFSTDDEVVNEPESIVPLESSNDVSEQETNTSPLSTTTPRSSQQRNRLLDELKYLLKPTNSLATQEVVTQATQEADSAIKNRTMQYDEDASYTAKQFSIDGLSPLEEKSLNAAERRSSAARGRRPSSPPALSDRSRARSIQPYSQDRTHSLASPTILIGQSEPRTFLEHLSGLIWAFLAAYAFSIILFLTKICGIDLIFGFFLQMVVQTIAFGIYAIYKGYNLLGPTGHRVAIILRTLLIGIGALTSFLAYYYITLPELSAIRQSQVVITIIISIFFFHERVTISRIIACVLTLIVIVILIRPTTFGAASPRALNSTDQKDFWIPYSSSWNYIVGISFALCTPISYSIASIISKTYFKTQHLPNTVLCFWSALSALFISMILVIITHFVIKDSRSIPHDWHLFVGIALALVSIFVFIANQKALKRERSSIVTLIYSTDIILALILQNLFTQIKTDIIVILGCILILASVFIICVEVLLMERRKRTLAEGVARAANKTADGIDLEATSNLKKKEQRISI